jgi:hypothetical protein
MAKHLLINPDFLLGTWVLKQEREGKIEIARERMEAVAEGIQLACEYAEAALDDVLSRDT